MEENNNSTSDLVFFISLDAETKSVIQATMIERNEAQKLLYSGSSVINYIAEIKEEVVREGLTPEEIGLECANLLCEIAEERKNASSPQCIPLAKYRKMVQLANLFYNSKQREQDG